MRFDPVVDDALLAFEVRVSKRWCDKEHDRGNEWPAKGVDVHYALKESQAEGEEGRVGWADGDRVAAETRLSCFEGEYCQILSGEPVEGFFPELVERISVAIFEAGLVGRLVIGDDEAVGIASSHVWICVVRADTIADPNDRDFVCCCPIR